MNHLIEQAIECPYCGESIVVLLEPTEQKQQYIEDCQVCCRPINFELAEELDGEMSLRVTHENE